MKTENRNFTPVTLVTGFLGAGKTTLLNCILKQAHDLKIAVIENELGEIDIDGGMLKSTEKIFKLANGCLCCTSNGDLVETLGELSKRREEFDHVVIETTGVANPASVLETFILNEDVADLFKIDAVVTVVDARHVALHIKSLECRNQIAFADIILLNKVDLVNDKELAAVTSLVRASNEFARILQVQQSEIDLKDVFNQGLFSETSALANLLADEEDHKDHKDHKHHDHHEHDHCGGCCDHERGAHDHSGHQLDRNHHDEDIKSVGLVFDGSLNPVLFNNWFADLLQHKANEIFRIKGILSVSGKDERVILQSVHRVSELTKGSAWGDEPRQNRIVFIGSGDSMDHDSLESGLKSCLS